MKYWLSHLPLEVWVDVYRYPWISREELGRIVDRFTNQKFTEYLQFYLHDWGKQKLNQLGFDKDGFYKRVDYPPYRLNMDLPLTPIPGHCNWVEENRNKMSDDRRIQIHYPTIGLIDPQEEEEEAQKPSTSKELEKSEDEEEEEQPTTPSKESSNLLIGLNLY